MKTEIKKLPKSQLEITFELTPEEFIEHFEHAIEHLKGSVKVDGFRPGQAPNKLVEEKLKPEMLLMEAGDHAVQHVYTDYIKESKLDVVGQPEVSIVKIAKGNEFVFKATVTVLPDVELPDHKEIAKTVKGKEVSVSDEEVQDALNYLQKSRAKMALKNDVAKKDDFVQIEYSCKEVEGGKNVDDQFVLGQGGLIKGFEDNLIGMKDGEEKTFTLEFPEKSPLAGKKGEFKVKMKAVHKMELPEINDEFAKQLGAFDTLVALKASMKEGMVAEKTEAEKQRVRAEILDKVAEKTKMEMPEAMVAYEQDRLLDDLKNRIAQTAKISFEEYLASVKKTEEEIKETYKKEAEKRMRGFLVLRALGKQEKVEISDKELEEEMKKYGAQVDIEQFKEYTKGVLFNEKVFKLLEECQ